MAVTAAAAAAAARGQAKPRAAQALLARLGGSRAGLSTAPPTNGPPGELVGLGRTEMPRNVSAGTGGRHSRGGQKIAIFGATGFMGGYVVNELGKHGHNMVVATRGDDVSWRHLKPYADYGKMVPSYVSIKDEKSIRDTIRGADTVINLMGKHYETKHYFPTLINCSFEDVHINGAELVARVAREEDVKHLVHVSSAYAKQDSQSRWARTKAVGEERVNKQFPGAVIVRPNTVYGDEDRYLIAYASMAMGLPAIPLVENGQAKQSPVYIGDVGRAIAAAAVNYTTAGKTFNLSGSQEYTTKQIIEYVMTQTGRHKPLVDVPVNIAELTGRVINNFPNPYLTEDYVKLMREDCPTASPSEATFADLGLNELSTFETKAYSFLYRFREGGHFVTPSSAKASHQ